MRYVLAECRTALTDSFNMFSSTQQILRHVFILQFLIGIDLEHNTNPARRR